LEALKLSYFSFFGLVDSVPVSNLRRGSEEGEFS
jgi:hypothetical protein